MISQCMPYIGYPRTLNALRCINEVLNAEDASCEWLEAVLAEDYEKLK